jgi:hypothetical protein
VNKIKLYITNLFRLLTQALNVILGGDPDEFLSSRLGKSQQSGRIAGKVLAPAVDALFYLFTREPNHCARSIEWDEGKNEVWTL